MIEKLVPGKIQKKIFFVSPKLYTYVWVSIQYVFLFIFFAHLQLLQNFLALTMICVSIFLMKFDNLSIKMPLLQKSYLHSPSIRFSRILCLSLQMPSNRNFANIQNKKVFVLTLCILNLFIFFLWSVMRRSIA